MHRYKIWTGYGWQRTYTVADFREADRKGLVEHDEWCDCVQVNDDPPF